MKLFDSEIKIMEVLWAEGDCTAKHISDQLKQQIGWNMNTTYTVIKRLIGKGVIERENLISCVMLCWAKARLSRPRSGS